MNKLLQIIAIWLPPLNVILLLTLGMLQVVNTMLIATGKSIKSVDWYTDALITQSKSGVTEFVLYVYYMISFMFTSWLIQLIF